MNQTIHNLLTEQLASWEMARNNYAALSGVQVKELNVRNANVFSALPTCRQNKEAFRLKDIIIYWSIRFLYFPVT